MSDNPLLRFGSAKPALNFLEAWYGSSTRVLTAIHPDNGDIRTAGFDASDRAGQTRFIAQSWGRRGLYFQVNSDLRPSRHIDSKASKSDIGSAVALQLDVDTYKSSTGPRAREELLARLNDKVPTGIPGPPSVVNNSGNGVQAFWLLNEPYVIKGDPSRAAEVERRNRGLAQAYGGDNTTDVSRIMRLPGTLNLPNAAKRRLGLKPVMAKQFRFDNEMRYDLSDFPAREALNAPGARTIPDDILRQAEKIPIGDGVPVETTFDLVQLSNRTQVTIALGTFPGKERLKDDGSPDRSAELFAVIVAMIRAGESNETILGVIMDPRWRISDSVLQKPEPHAYARRQIRRAHARLSAQIRGEFNDLLDGRA